MASTQIALPEQIWVQLTTTEKQGSIRHQSGNGTVIYTESTTEPSTQSAITPVMEETRKSQGFVYYDVDPSEFVWAYSISGDSVVTVTPGGA